MRIYISHFLTSWTERVFEFLAYILLAKIFHESLLLPSIYGFITTLSAVFLSSHVGHWVDKLPRLSFVRNTLLVQKTAIIICSIVFYILLRQQHHDVGQMAGFCVIVVCSCVLKLAFIGNNIAVEKDWVMVISGGNTETMITVMRRIDLFCKTVAPVSIGFLTLAPSAPIIVALWNVVSFLIEYNLIYHVYKDCPELDEEYTPLIDHDVSLPSSSTSTTPTGRRQRQKKQNNNDHGVSFMEYLQHDVFRPSFALALLYLTVLSFGGIMVTYLKLEGYNDMTLGMLRAVAGIMGMGATYILPMLSQRIGMIRTGLWALWFECACLVPVILSFSKSIPYGYILLFGGMSLSRIGLWLFDMTETILLQQFVDADKIGGIAGWQHSLCSFFDLSQYVLTMIFSDPSKFYIPAIISFCSVLLATITYTSFVKKQRGHLVHLHID
ncbi:Ferroporti-1 [Phascolomyces articulosus]|uniref:Solute carrier family 40 member n=1 Tax=Phascolomyces articulosus TaxID=60185 RepID=A0AAD5PD95_9FUNG|nr:Ferroporti-1 [Phascolomyces articulosus]